MRPNQTSLVRRLSELAPDTGHIVSAYFDLDPAKVPNVAARTTLVESVMDDARRQCREARLDVDAHALERDLERIGEWMNGPAPGDAAHGAAVFSAADAGVFEALTLHRPVATGIHVGRTAVLEPLIEALAPDSWCVLLVNRRTARLFRGDHDRLVESREVTDHVPTRSAQGGWSAERHQRHIDGAAKDHVQHTCDVLFREFQRAPFDALAIGVQDETWPDVDAALHATLRQHFAGRIDIDVEHTSAEEVLEASRDVFSEYERARESEVLDSLQQGLAHGAAVAGLDGVLDELAARRVETLVLGQRFEAPGVVCPHCGWVGRKGEKCPFDEHRTERRADIVECAIDAALQQAADVVVLQHSNYESHDGPVAAILRFPR